MAPKGRTKSGTSKLAWETELIGFDLNDPEWTCQVHFVLGENGVVQRDLQERLKQSISTRQRFSLITNDYALEYVLDKKNKTSGAKFVEVLDSCKNAVDNTDITSLSQLSAPTLAKLVKFLLIRAREADCQRILAKKQKEEGCKSAGGKKPKSPPGKGKQAKSPEVEVKKDWSNLKKRGEVDEEEEKEEYIDDEPDEGPTHYVILTGFSESNLPLLLSEMNCDIMSIIQIKGDHSAVIPSSTQLQSASDNNGNNNNNNHENSGNIAEKFEFWSDLETIFRRGLTQKRLVDCTRWQLTIYESDTDGSYIFDEVASLCYDLLDQFKAYRGFADRLRLIPIPTISGGGAAEPQSSNESKLLQKRYSNHLANFPLLSQSVNVITHALREAVVEVVDEVKFEDSPIGSDLNPIKGVLSAALGALDLTEEEMTELGDLVQKDESKKDNVELIYYGDTTSEQISMTGDRYREKLDPIETEMTGLLPLKYIFESVKTSRASANQNSAKLAEIDYNLTKDGVYSQSEIKRALMQLSAAAMPLSTVDEDGNLIDAGDGDHPPYMPWDSPQQLIPSQNKNQKNLGGGGIDDVINDKNSEILNWSTYERFNSRSAIQSIVLANRESTVTDVLPLQRDNAILVVCHNPKGKEGTSNQGQNISSWRTQAVTNCGFRQWIEHIFPVLGDWMRLWELEQARQELERRRAEQAVLEAERIAKDSAQDKVADERDFIVPGSIKAEILEAQSSDNISNVRKKKSAGSRRSLTKSSAAGRRSAGKSRSGSRAGSKSKLSNRSSSRLSNSSKSGEKSEKSGDGNNGGEENRLPEFSGYAMNREQLLGASGHERSIFTEDGGRVRIKRAGFINSNDSLSICIDHDGNFVHYYQNAPRDISNRDSQNEKGEIEKNESTESTNGATETGIANNNQGVPAAAESNLSLATTGGGTSGSDIPLEIPSATFTSVSVLFRDGLTASFSKSGPTGRPPNHNVEQAEEERRFGQTCVSMSPTPSRDSGGTPKGRREKSPKGSKKKDKSDMSISLDPGAPASALVSSTVLPINNDNGLPTGGSTDEGDESSQTFDQLQQVYISAPDGLTFRFGRDQKTGKLYVRQYYNDNCGGDANLKEESGSQNLNYQNQENNENERKNGRNDEISRIISYENVLRILPNNGYQELNYDGLMRVSSADIDEKYEITPSGKICRNNSIGINNENNDEENKKRLTTNGVNLLSYTGTDQNTRDIMTVRYDGFMKVERSNDTIYQYPDGTRVTRNKNDIQIEKPGTAAVLFENNGEKCLVVLGNGTLIQVEASGSYHLSHHSGASFAVGEDGTVLFTPKQESTSTHIIRQLETNALEVIEPDGMTTIQISNTGKTSILRASQQVEEEEGTPDTTGDENLKDQKSSPVRGSSAPDRSRYFFLSRDENAIELYPKDEAEQLFSSVESHPLAASVVQQVPDSPQQRAVTLLEPFSPQSSWAVSTYQEESIVPEYLKQSDLERVPGLRASMLQLDKEIGGDNPSDNRISDIPMLQVRNFVVGTSVSQPIKEHIYKQLAEVARNYADLAEERNSQVEQADEDGAKHGEVRKQLLNRFLELATELEQPDAEQLRAHWLNSVTEVPVESKEPPKPKLTDADWAKIKQDNVDVKTGLEALRNHDVPNYWESEQGKKFLAGSRGDNCAKEAAKNLPLSSNSKPVGGHPPINQNNNAETSLDESIETNHDSILNEPGDQPISSNLISDELMAEMEQILANGDASNINSRQDIPAGYRLEFEPRCAHFGVLREGDTYSMSVRLKNTGTATARYKIISPKNVRLKYRMGPIAAGLDSKVEIIILAEGGELRDDGIFDYVKKISVMTPTRDPVILPIEARIIPLSEIERLKVLGKGGENINNRVKKIS